MKKFHPSSAINRNFLIYLTDKYHDIKISPMSFRCYDQGFSLKAGSPRKVKKYEYIAFTMS